MSDRSLLFVTFILVVLLGALNLLAIAFYLYWTVWWFDIIMHFLGGLSIGLLFLWIVRRSGLLGASGGTRKTILLTLVAILIIGAFWEVFEYLGGIMESTEENKVIDTAVDLAADITGAIFAGIVGSRKMFYDSSYGRL